MRSQSFRYIETFSFEKVAFALDNTPEWFSTPEHEIHQKFPFKQILPPISKIFALNFVHHNFAHSWIPTRSLTHPIELPISTGGDE